MKEATDKSTGQQSASLQLSCQSWIYILITFNSPPYTSFAQSHCEALWIWVLLQHCWRKAQGPYLFFSQDSILELSQHQHSEWYPGLTQVPWALLGTAHGDPTHTSHPGVTPVLRPGGIMSSLLYPVCQCWYSCEPWQTHLQLLGQPALHHPGAGCSLTTLELFEPVLGPFCGHLTEEREDTREFY